MNEKGVSVSLVVFLLSTTVLAILYFSDASYDKYCQCSDTGVCCFERKSAGNDYAPTFLCDGECFCPFSSAEEDPCRSREKKFKDLAMQLVLVSAVGLLSSLVSTALFYFEPWYALPCCWDEDDDDEENILQGSVIRGGVSLSTLEERGAAKLANK